MLHSPLAPYAVAPAPQHAWPAFPTVEAFDTRFRHEREHAALVLGHSASTIRWLRDGYLNLRRFLGGDAASAPVTLTPDLLDAWVAWNRTNGIAAHTLRTYFGAVKRTVGAIATRDGTSNPFQHVRAPGLPEHVYKALPPSACERILAAARNYPWPNTYERARAVAMLATALYAGLRKREILRLEVLDVDLDEATIRVRRGKGKNGGKDRTAYMPSQLQDLLRAYLVERRRHQFTNPEFFASPKTRRGVSDVTFRRIVDKVRQAAGVRFSLHVLRHSFVTMLLRSGVPIHVARDLAGHADIKTTEGYARVFDEDMRRHVQAVRFGGADGHDRSTESFPTS
ncbi:MAG TPA: site-specific integrase [Thermoanaerobaculia bacterium]|nr:site-specific integrase [Thermoanaerobaculia bacterium]